MQDNADFANKYVKMYCDTNQFPELPFCGSHPKPHGARWLNKKYRLRFDPKLGHGICAILRIICAYVACAPILDKTWVYDIPSTKQVRCQPVTNFTYWPVLGSYNNWNIIDLTPKPIHFEAFDEINKVVLDWISENMASLLQYVKYGAINTDDTTTDGL